MPPLRRLAALAFLLVCPLACSDVPVMEIGRVVVEFNSNGIPADLAAEAEALGGRVVRTHPEIDVALLTGLTDEQAETLAGRLGARGWARDLSLQLLPGIEAVPRPRQLVRPAAAGFQAVRAADAEPQSLDPTGSFYYDRQWNLQIAGFAEAIEAGYEAGADVRVAILDTGIDPDHVDLVGRIDEAASIAFSPSFSGPPEWVDDNYHGTHVAGIVSTNNFGTTGAAPGATLIAVKVCDFAGRCSGGDILAGILHAVDVGADVINLSLSGSFVNRFGNFFNALLHKAVAYANRHGVLVVAAAGNSAVDLQHTGNVRFFPCEISNVFCISASQFDDKIAVYTNYGAQAIGVAAPGGSIGPLFDTWVLAPCTSHSVLFTGCESGDIYLFLRGTSMAAPHASAAAALLRGYEPGITPGALRARIEQTAVDLGAPGADPYFGKGRLDACAALGC